jgi:hypothetical protein
MKPNQAGQKNRAQKPDSPKINEWNGIVNMDIAQVRSFKLGIAMGMNRKNFIVLILSLLFLLGKIESGQSQETQTKEKIISTFTGKIPKEWGEKVTGVKTRLITNQKVITLTFDACRGPRSSGYDVKLINYLTKLLHFLMSA